MTQNPEETKPRLSNEMFYLVDGVKQDAALHEEMLADGEGGSLDVSIALAIKAGVSPEAIEQLYGVPYVKPKT